MFAMRCNKLSFTSICVLCLTYTNPNLLFEKSTFCAKASLESLWKCTDDGMDVV